MTGPGSDGRGAAPWYAKKRDLPLGVKVTLGSAGLLGVVLVSMVAAIYVVLGMKDAESVLTNGDVTYGEAVDAAALDAKGIANDERGFLLSGDSTFMDEARERIGSARSAFDSAALAATNAQQRQAVNRAQAGFERWVAAVDRETAVFRAGQRRDAISASLGATRALRKTYERSLAQAQDLDRAELESARADIETDSSRSVRLLVVWLGIGLVVGLFIAVWLVRAIAIPVARMVTLLSALTGSAAAPME